MSQSIKQTMYPQNITYVYDLLSSVFSNVNLKITGAAMLSLGSFFFGETLQNMTLVMLFTLIIFDTITGVAAAYMNKEAIESRKIFRTAVKIAVYFLLVSAGHLSEVATHHILPVEATILAFLALTELVSILENAGKMGYTVPQTLLNRIKEIRDNPTRI